jgi:hypothetical protein
VIILCRKRLLTNDAHHTQAVTSERVGLWNRVHRLKRLRKKAISGVTLSERSESKSLP